MSIPQQRNAISPYTPEQPSWQPDHHPQAPPSTGGNSPGLFRILLRRRKYLVMAAVVAFCIAVIVTMATRSQSWTHDMIVNYTPVTEFNAAYQSPTVNTLAQFMKAPEIEATMREEFPDYDFGPNFDNAFGVVVPYDTQTVEISLTTSDDSYGQAFRDWFSQFFHLKTWSTPPRFVDDWHRRFALAKDNVESSQRRSERVLNRFQTVFAEYVAKERRNALRRHTEDLRESMETWKEKLKTRKSELAAFNEKHRVQDLKLETDALLQQVASWESRLEEARLAKTATNKELEEIKRRLAALREATSSAQETADELKKLGHTPQRLIERTQRRMHVEKLRAQVEQEKASFAYDTKLHEKQYLSDKIYQQKKMQLAALEKELEGAERIWQLELQIERRT